MNTQIYLWIEPLYRRNERVKGKEYYYLILKEDLSHLNHDEITEKHIADVLDFADVSQNWDYGVISHSLTEVEPGISKALSPKEIKNQQKKEKLQYDILLFTENKEDVLLTKENIQAEDNGIIAVNYPKLKIKDSINFGNLWDSLEKNILGKIKDGDSAAITDDYGNVLFELKGGGFLSMVSPDIEVYDASAKITNKSSIWDRGDAIKGGVYIRENGKLDIGDIDRSFYLNINVGNLLKTSLKLGKSLNELTSGEEIKKLLK